MDEPRSPSLPTSPAASIIVFPSPSTLFVLQLLGTIRCPEKPRAAQREMIVVATSAANQCLYCIIAHVAILRIRAKNPLIADQVASNDRKAGITACQRAMLDFAMKVSQQAQAVDKADSVARREHGFSDDY